MFFWKKKKESPEEKLQTAAEYFRQGDAHTRRHEFDEAEKWYLKCVSVLEPLSRQYDSPQIQRELSRAYSMMNVMGRMTTDFKKRNEAAEWLKKSLAIDEKLAAQAGTPQAYDDLACSYSGLGGMTLDPSYCEKALSIWRDLHKKYPNEPLYEKRIKDEEFNIGRLKEILNNRKS